MTNQETGAAQKTGIDQDAGFQPPPLALALVGLFLLIGAILLWTEASQLSPLRGMGVGPSIAPRLIGGMFLALSIAHFISAWRSRGRAAISIDGIRSDKTALAWAVGGMILLIVLIALDAGFILSTTVLFAATARAFGKPVGIKSLGIGLLIALASSLFFTLVLTLTLPHGWVESLIYPGF